MSKSAMLLPKPSKQRRTPFIPVGNADAIPWLARLAPPERRAMREIGATGDIFAVNGRTFILAQVSAKAVDALAAVEADLAERENDLEDEDTFDR